MEKITYLQGDCTAAQPLRHPESRVVIPHSCNTIGAWGAGFVMALSKKWPEPEAAYKNWYNNGYTLPGEKFSLGQIQIVKVMDSHPLGSTATYVCNMIAQEGIRPRKGVPPIRYDALRNCLIALRNRIDRASKAEIHAPMFGAGLAGGDWNKIEGIIQDELCQHDIPVFIYRLEEGT